MVTTELGALAPVQKEMLAIQNGNWKGIQDRFGIFQHNIQVLHDCDRQSFHRQQIKFNCHTNFPLVAVIFANIKIYRSYLHTYWINKINSKQPMLNYYLPFPLVARQSLCKILDNVAFEQWRISDGLNLVIPSDEILVYYESKLLRDVINVKKGVVTHRAIPLATKESAFTAFWAIAVPMPQPENDRANKWKLEAPYLAISENNDDTAFLTEYDLARCSGSTRSEICLDMIATEARNESWLTTLYFNETVEALQNCKTEQTILPSTEKAENWSSGAWVINSATTAYTLRESDTKSTTSSGFTKYPVCPNLYNHLEVRKASVWSSQQDEMGPHYLRTTSGYQSKC